MTRTRTPRIRPLLIGASCLLAVLVLYVVAGRLLADDDIVSSWAGPVTIHAESDLAAGAGASVEVTANAPDGTPIQLAVFAPVDSALLDATLSQGRAQFTLAPELARHAGLYRLVAQVDRSESSVHQLQVRPGAAVNPMVPLVGPRTIIADGSDRTMTVVTPIDRFGNPVSDGTPVEIELLWPSGDRSVVTEAVDRALVAILIESTTEAGRVTISASVSDADGPNNVVDQVAGIPAPFTIDADTRNALADGFALHAVQTSELRDEFGNTFPDGVSAVFVLEDGDRTSLVQTTVQGGIARAVIEAPSEPGQVVITARVSGAQSAPTAIDFAPAVSVFVATQQVSESGVTIEIGPVVTARGGYVPDGTVVTIREQDNNTVIADAALRGGIAEVVLDNTGVALEAEVLGAVVPIEDS